MSLSLGGGVLCHHYGCCWIIPRSAWPLCYILFSISESDVVRFPLCSALSAREADSCSSAAPFSNISNINFHIWISDFFHYFNMYLNFEYSLTALIHSCKIRLSSRYTVSKFTTNIYLQYQLDVISTTNADQTFNRRRNVVKAESNLLFRLMSWCLSARKKTMLWSWSSRQVPHVKVNDIQRSWNINRILR